MNTFKWCANSFLGLLLVSCVTINIYFPAAAAEKAADRIIEDVWGPETAPTAPESQQNNSSRTMQSSPLAINLINWLVAPALAAEADLNINSPAIAALQAKMKTRHDTHLKIYYDKGAIGLTENGLITIRDPKTIALKDRNTVSAWVADENKDRNALYAEIARANGHPEWQADIQATFSRRWISNAASGWWYQTAGNWQQK